MYVYTQTELNRIEWNDEYVDKHTVTELRWTP